MRASSLGRWDRQDSAGDGLGSGPGRVRQALVTLGGMDADDDHDEQCQHGESGCQG
jgi:hypothetical protein